MRNYPIKLSLLLLALALLATSCNPKNSPNNPISTPVTKPTPSRNPADYKTASGRRPQFVVIAFDGSHSLDMWQKTLDFALQMSDQNSVVHFTYFLSGVYFLNYRKAERYQPPQEAAGKSLIGFADSNIDIEKRVAFVNRAIAEGHEIGSHANGHFSGSNWLKD